MAGSWFYDLLYRVGAPWDDGVRSELRGLVESGRLDPSTHPRVLDLGCGSGSEAIYLAERGFDVVGVDFSPVALERAEKAAAEAGVADRCRFVPGDLTQGEIPGVEGTFDVLLDFGALDDLKGEARAGMVRTIHRYAHPGAHFVLWCFFTTKEGLPRFRFKGVSRMHTVIEPGEEQRLFGDAFDIERLPEPPPSWHMACFLMTHR